MRKKDYPEHTKEKKGATPLMLRRLPYMLFTRYNRASRTRVDENDALSTIFYINLFCSLPSSDCETLI